MTYIYHTFFYQPMYNGLVFLIGLLPTWAGVGISIIIFTVIIRLILFPLSRVAVKSQLQMKELQPQIDAIKANKSNQSEQSMQIMKLYKDNKINPFSGLILILVQLPILFALYKLFLSGGLPVVQMDLLYSFIQVPEVINMKLFLIDLTKKSIVLALLAAITQYFQVRFSMPITPKNPNETKGPSSFGTDMAHAMSVQMRYVLPAIVFFAAYSFNAGIAIYWTTTNLFTIGQELVIRRKFQAPK